MTQMEANVKKMEDQLKRWGEKLNVLVAKAEAAGAQAKTAHHQRIDLIKQKLAAAQAKLDEFKEAGSEKWDGFKSGIEAAWKDLEAAFKEVSSAKDPNRKEKSK